MRPAFDLHPPQYGRCVHANFQRRWQRVEACGNGARAVAAYLTESGTSEPIIETLGGTLHARTTTQSETNFPAIIMPPPRFEWQDIPLAEGCPTLRRSKLHRDLPPTFMVSVGNPHAVIFVESGTAGLAAQYGFELEKTAATARREYKFAACTGDNIIKLDTWERGAGLTQACGTGAAPRLAAPRQDRNHNNEFRIEPPCARAQSKDKARNQSDIDDGISRNVNYGGTA